MTFHETSLPGVLLVEPDVFQDSRGCFLETYHEEKYQQQGIGLRFVQDNFSSSIRGTLRGLHLQTIRPQGKLIRVVKGEIFDVAVDVRKGSPTYASWYGTILRADQFMQLYVPPGFGHGFCVLSDIAEVEYKCTDFYTPEGEITIKWDDEEIGIQWPVHAPLLSRRLSSRKPFDWKPSKFYWKAH